MSLIIKSVQSWGYVAPKVTLPFAWRTAGSIEGDWVPIKTKTLPDIFAIFTACHHVFNKKENGMTAIVYLLESLNVADKRCKSSHVGALFAICALSVRIDETVVDARRTCACRREIGKGLARITVLVLTNVNNKNAQSYLPE